MNHFFLQADLQQRYNQGLLRKLSPTSNLTDFSSNDYLGFARSKEVSQMILNEYEVLRHSALAVNGSTGSRLLTGNSHYVEELENLIAEFHYAEAGLIFNSGYTANIGLLTAVAGKDDIIFYDELSHASIYDGIRLSKAQSFPFKHNDLTYLEDRLKLLQKSRNSDCNYFVVVESIYSMDGDFAPLNELVSLCEMYDAYLIVDEAHATGIFGKKNGEGLVVNLGLEKRMFARIHTFGKALGCHGAIVLGSKILKAFLINFSRPFIYTTALPLHSLIAIRCAYTCIGTSSNIILNITTLINLFIEKVSIDMSGDFIKSCSTIQSFIYPGNENVRLLAACVQKEGFDVRPILSPTVPKGKERIRICLHSFNTLAEVNELLLCLRKNSLLVSNKK